MAKSEAFLVVVALCVAGAAEDWKNFHVKFALWNGYYSMPLTLDEISQGKQYFKVVHDDELNVDLYSYPGDPRVLILIDTYGNIAGIRTSYIKGDVAQRAKSKNLTFDYSYDDKPMFTSGNYWGIDLWYTSVLFVSPDKLRAGGRQNTGGLVAEDIYLKLDGVWTLIPKDQCKVEAIGFTKQACFLGMGMHYFYQVTPTSQCEDFQGPFLLYESGQLIGLGIIPFGTFTSLSRVWFEDPPARVVKDIVPNGPSCMADWINNYGGSSLHLFFKECPRLTFCCWPWQKSNQCKN